MNKVLVVCSSLAEKMEESVTRTALNLFLEEYKMHNPHDEITILNLSENKKASMLLNSHDRVGFWDEEASALTEQILSVDKLIITAGMNNFNIPAILKNYIDIMMVANKTFKYKYSNNHEGLLTNIKSAQLILSQGSPQDLYAQWDGFQGFLEGLLTFVAVQKQATINIDKTKITENLNKNPSQLVDERAAEIKAAAKKF